MPRQALVREHQCLSSDAHSDGALRAVREPDSQVWAPRLNVLNKVRCRPGFGLAPAKASDLDAVDRLDEIVVAAATVHLSATECVR